MYLDHLFVWKYVILALKKSGKSLEYLSYQNFVGTLDQDLMGDAKKSLAG